MTNRDQLHLAHNALSRALECITKKELKANDVRAARENAGIATAKLLDIERRMAGVDAPKQGD